jgi:hypothetical protein
MQTLEDIKLQQEIDNMSDLDSYTQAKLLNSQITPEEKTKSGLNPQQKQELLSVMKGIRPNGMDFDMFKTLRTYLGRLNKAKLKGTYKHISNGIIVKDAQGKEVFKKLNKGITYKKDNKNGM